MPPNDDVKVESKQGQSSASMVVPFVYTWLGRAVALRYGAPRGYFDKAAFSNAANFDYPLADTAASSGAHQALSDITAQVGPDKGRLCTIKAALDMTSFAFATRRPCWIQRVRERNRERS